MWHQVVDAANYTASPFAIPTGVAMLAMLWLSIVVVVRERGSWVSRLFALMGLTICLWLFAFSWMYCATDERVALWWAKAAYLGVPLIPSAVHHFTIAVLRASRQHKRLLRVSWALSLGFAAAIVGTDALIAGLYRYWWGYYPRYGWLSFSYLTFFFGMMIVSLRLYWIAYRKATPGTTHWRRVRAFTCAFSIVYLGSVDYLAKYGLPVYPFGYLPVLVFLVLAARAIKRYHLIDITPAFAAAPILEAMVEPVLVLDLEGTVRLANRAACELVERPEQALRGQSAAQLLDHPLLAERLEAMLKGQATSSYDETAYLRPSTGDLRMLSLSMSIIPNQAGDPVAVVCFVKDITERKQAEQTLARIAELAEEWQGAQRPSPEVYAEPGEATTTVAPTPHVPWFLRSGWRLFGTLFLTLAVPMGVVIVLEANHARRSLERQAIQENAKIASLVAKAAEEHFTGLMRYVESLSRRPSFAQAVEGRVPEAVRTHLQDLVRQNPGLDRAFITDPTGVLWVDFPPDPAVVGEDFSFRDWYQGVSTTQQTYVSEVYQRSARPQPYLVGIATPIRSPQHETVGYLVGQTTLQNLTRWLIQSRLLESGAIELLDRRGVVAAGNAAEPPSLTDLGQHPAVRRALGGEEGWIEARDPRSGEATLISAAVVHPIGWVVLVRQPMELLFRPARQLGRTVIGLALIGFLVMFLAGFVWVNAMHRSHQLLLAVDRAKAQHVAELKRALVERTRAENALRQLAAIVECSTDGIISNTLDGAIISWNRGAERLCGYSADEVKGRSIALLAPPDRPEEIPQILSTIAQNESIEHFETVWRRRDGHLIDVALTVSPIKDAAGQAIGASTIARDITQHKQAELQLKRTNELLVKHEGELMDTLVQLNEAHGELLSTQLQLVQVAKMESVGRLAAGVAHEVKNPLAILLMGLDYLSKHLRRSENNVPMVLRDMEQAVKRADTVIKGLLDFSAPKELDLTSGAINPVVEQALLLVKHALDRQHVALVKELGEGLPPVRRDSNKLEQVFVNLFMNALDAMPSGGTLSVKTFVKALATFGPQVGRRDTDRFRVGEDTVVVEVGDTGSGIPEQHLPKIFDPFFTTKPTGKGTGLGLAVTKTIIEMHGGTIDIRNRDDGGVRVTVMLKAERG